MQIASKEQNFTSLAQFKNIMCITMRYQNKREKEKMKVEEQKSIERINIFSLRNR